MWKPSRRRTVDGMIETSTPDTTLSTVHALPGRRGRGRRAYGDLRSVGPSTTSPDVSAGTSWRSGLGWLAPFGCGWRRCRVDAGSRRRRSGGTTQRHGGTAGGSRAATGEDRPRHLALRRWRWSRSSETWISGKEVPMPWRFEGRLGWVACGSLVTRQNTVIPAVSRRLVRHLSRVSWSATWAPTVPGSPPPSRC